MKLKTLTLLLVIFSQLAAFGKTNPADNTDQSLKILSWNIYMLPRKIMHTGQSERAEVIARQLKDTDYDLIVFQEAFDKTARNLLWDKLKEVFPYQQGPVNEHGSAFRTNGGVWVISRYPITKLGEIKYKHAIKADFFARKGAMLLELTKNGKTYHVAGTHLQAQDGKRCDEIRTEQYNQLVSELLVPFHNDSIPEVVCGDFNISKNDLKHYNRLVRSIDPSDNPTCDKEVCQKTQVPVMGVQQYTYDYTKNDLISSPCEITTYDYIFVKRNHTNFKEISRKIRLFAGAWGKGKKQKKDLSDHFAMEITLVPGNN